MEARRLRRRGAGVEVGLQQRRRRPSRLPAGQPARRPHAARAPDVADQDRAVRPGGGGSRAQHRRRHQRRRLPGELERDRAAPAREPGRQRGPARHHPQERAGIRSRRTDPQSENIPADFQIFHSNFWILRADTVHI